MKRYIITIALVLSSLSTFAQNTIKFLGIPIDGTKREFIWKLQAKGFEYDAYYDVLTGEFNGQHVSIFVETASNRVWRVAVHEAMSLDDADIKIRFNTLLNQFSNNGKYIKVRGEKFTNADTYLVLMDKKRHEAHFSLVDKSINGRVWYRISGGHYYHIELFYENLDNAANGDDL